MEIPTSRESLKKPDYELFGTFEEPDSTFNEDKNGRRKKESQILTKEVMKDIKFISITVDTKNQKLIIRTNKKGFDPLEFNIALGSNGVAEKGEGIEGDKKTPKGEVGIRGLRLPEGNPRNEVFTRNGDASLGPVFIYFDTEDENGKNRGMGFHGSNENVLRNTDGCIRLYNDDLLLIQDKFEVGMKVIII